LFSSIVVSIPNHLSEWYFPIDSDGKKSLSEEGQKEFDRTGFADSNGKLNELAEVEYHGSGLLLRG